MTDTEKSRHLVIDIGYCYHCNYCSYVLPEVFACDDDGTSYVHNQFGASEKDIQEVIENCPNNCIFWATLKE
jgi:ferredoxin